MKALPKRIQNQLERCRKKVAEFNDMLTDYIRMTGSNDVPTIDSTVIGYDPMELYEVREKRNGFDVECNGITYEVRVKHEAGECYVSGIDDVAEQIAYDKRAIRKGIRVWQAENPDEELEKDEDE